MHDNNSRARTRAMRQVRRQKYATRALDVRAIRRDLSR